MFLRSAEMKVPAMWYLLGRICEKLEEGLSKNLNGILLTLFLLLEMKLYMDYGS
jgi:hypothetical protein